MSLKLFHLVFVTLATLLAVGFAVWAWQNGQPVLAGLSAVVALGLPVYGWWFVRKTKGVGYL